MQTCSDGKTARTVDRREINGECSSFMKETFGGFDFFNITLALAMRTFIRQMPGDSMGSSLASW